MAETEDLMLARGKLLKSGGCSRLINVVLRLILSEIGVWGLDMDQERLKGTHVSLEVNI